MAKQVSDFLLERISQWGVKRIYGYPGDGINGILGGLERHLEQFEFVQVRHEEGGIIEHATKELIGGILPSKDKG